MGEFTGEVLHLINTSMVNVFITSLLNFSGKVHAVLIRIRVADDYYKQGNGASSYRGGNLKDYVKRDLNFTSRDQGFREIESSRDQE